MMIPALFAGECVRNEVDYHHGELDIPHIRHLSIIPQFQVSSAANMMNDVPVSRSKLVLEVAGRPY